jgi:hypothetical protein
MFLVLYMGLGAMGNHYVKVYYLIANFLYLLVFVANGLLFGILLSSREEGFLAMLWWQRFCIPQALTMFWLFQIGNVINSVANPSISEIIPNKLYLGNAMLLPLLLQTCCCCWQMSGTLPMHVLELLVVR